MLKRSLAAAVNGAQTSLDPKELKEWLPNYGYGAHAFGLSSFKELDPGPANGVAPMGFHREPMQFRASPDGRTISSFGGGEHFWHIYSLTENGAAVAMLQPF